MEIAYLGPPAALLTHNVAWHAFPAADLPPLKILLKLLRLMSPNRFVLPLFR